MVIWIGWFWKSTRPQYFSEDPGAADAGFVDVIHCCQSEEWAKAHPEFIFYYIEYLGHLSHTQRQLLDLFFSEAMFFFFFFFGSKFCVLPQAYWADFQLFTILRILENILSLLCLSFSICRMVWLHYQPFLSFTIFRTVWLLYLPWLSFSICRMVWLLYLPSLSFPICRTVCLHNCHNVFVSLCFCLPHLTWHNWTLKN